VKLQTAARLKKGSRHPAGSKAQQTCGLLERILNEGAQVCINSFEGGDSFHEILVEGCTRKISNSSRGDRKCETNGRKKIQGTSTALISRPVPRSIRSKASTPRSRGKTVTQLETSTLPSVINRTASRNSSSLAP